RSKGRARVAAPPAAAASEEQPMAQPTDDGREASAPNPADGRPAPPAESAPSTVGPSVNTRHAPVQSEGPRVDLDGDDVIAVPTRRLPFLVGVLADLSGQPDPPLRPLKDRRFVPLEPPHFDELLRTTGPRLVLQVPNRLADAPNPVRAELTFQSLADF